MPDPTNEERKAIEAFVKGTLSPLIEAVLTKKLSQAALFMRDELQARKPALQRIAELLEDGEGPDIEDLLTDDTKRPRLSAEERAQLAIIVRWARLPVDGVRATPGPRWHEDLRELLLELRPMTAYGVVGSRDVDQAKYRTALDQALGLLDAVDGVAPAHESALPVVAYGYENTRPTERAALMMVKLSNAGDQYPELAVPLVRKVDAEAAIAAARGVLASDGGQSNG